MLNNQFKELDTKQQYISKIEVIIPAISALGVIPTLNDADSRDSQKATNLNRWRKQEVCDGFGDFVAVIL